MSERPTLWLLDSRYPIFCAYRATPDKDRGALSAVCERLGTSGLADPVSRFRH